MFLFYTFPTIKHKHNTYYSCIHIYTCGNAMGTSTLYAVLVHEKLNINIKWKVLWKIAFQGNNLPRGNKKHLNIKEVILRGAAAITINYYLKFFFSSHSTTYTYEPVIYYI